LPRTKQIVAGNVILYGRRQRLGRKKKTKKKRVSAAAQWAERLVFCVRTRGPSARVRGAGGRTTGVSNMTVVRGVVGARTTTGPELRGGQCPGRRLPSLRPVRPISTGPYTRSWSTSEPLLGRRRIWPEGPASPPAIGTENRVRRWHNPSLLTVGRTHVGSRFP